MLLTLPRFGIGRLNDTYDFILSNLVISCFRNNSPGMISPIVEYFDRENELTGFLTTYEYLFTLPLNDMSGENIFSFLADSMGRSAAETYLTLISFPTRSVIGNAYVHVLAGYGDLEDDDYITLYETAKHKKNEEAVDFFIYRLAQVSPFRERPPWIIDQTDEENPEIGVEEEEYDIDSRDIPDPSIEEIAKKTVTLIVGDGQVEIDEADFSEAVANIQTFLSSAGEKEKEEFLAEYKSSVRKELYDDSVKRFRLYGPVNRDSFGEEYRMLITTSFEESIFDEFDPDIEENVVVEWFNGVCEVCFYGIQKKSWAIRKPLIGGGWKGCYCCKECILDSITEEEAKDLPGRLEVLMDQLNEIGILDQEIEEEIEQQIKERGLVEFFTEERREVEERRRKTLGPGPSISTSKREESPELEPELTMERVAESLSYPEPREIVFQTRSSRSRPSSPSPVLPY